MTGAHFQWTPAKVRDLRTRLRVVAVGVLRRRKVFQLRSRGAPMLGAEVEDLIDFAVDCLATDNPPIDNLAETVLAYCRTRMDYKVRTICARDENQPNIHHAPVAPTDVAFEGDDYTLEIIPDTAPLADVIFSSTETLNQFGNVLRQGKPELAALFQLQLRQDTDVATEARMLGRTVEEIYELRRQLEKAKKRFRAYLLRDFGGLL